MRILDFWSNLWIISDRLLILFYRITGNPVLDYFLGTFCVALVAVFIGELFISFAYLLNRGHITTINVRMTKFHNLSMSALKSGNKTEYKRHNKEANDAFGKVFFNAIALSAAFLWPIFFILAWMQTRFAGLKFPLPFGDLTVNYVAIFLLCYILARILFNMLRPRLPYFGRIKKMIDSCSESQ